MVKINNKGITLVELIIVMSLILVILTLTFYFDIFAIRGLQIGYSNSELQHNTRLASDYILEELRNAYTINILDSKPDPLDSEKRYFYVENNNIKHVMSGVETNIMQNTPSDFTTEIIFENKTDNEKIIKYTVNSSFKNRKYSLSSEINPYNLLETEVVDGVTVSGITGSSGSVIEYSSPLTDDEIVEIDKILFVLKKYNLFLVEETDGSLTSRPFPYPNNIMLPKVGPNGSTISWFPDPSYPSVITNNGVIDRPDTGEGDITVTLTSKFSFGDEETTKEFDINIKEMETLELISNTLPYAQVGEEYSFALEASGGSGAYIFTSSDITQAGLEMSLNTNGQITGIPSTSGDYTFNVVLEDENSSITDSHIFNITVN